jgi:hypothetical protein
MMGSRIGAIKESAMHAARILWTSIPMLACLELCISSFTGADIQVDIVPPPTDRLQPQGTLAWTVRLTKHVRGSAAGQVHLQLDYRWQPETAGELVPGVALGTIDIQDRLPEMVDKVAAARI